MPNTKIDLEEQVRNRLLSHYGNEEYIWSGRYRYVTKMHCYIIALILFVLAFYGIYKGWKVLTFLMLFGIAIAIFATLKLYTNTFEITTKRLKIKQFLLFKTFVHYIEYYEIIDSQVELYGKGRGRITFTTQKPQFATITFPLMEDVAQKIDIIRELIEDKRTYIEHMEKQGHLRDTHDG
ncbi:MAG: hypothetical protein U9N49_09160 [Campylobacterota bacterium]|nr:hypothetical protein [Campylobacterota bacterium]